MTSLIQIKLATDSPYDISGTLIEFGLIPSIGDVIELPGPDDTPGVDPVPFLVLSRHFETRWIDEGKLQITGVLLFVVEPETVVGTGCLFRTGRRW